MTAPARPGTWLTLHDPVDPAAGEALVGTVGAALHALRLGGRECMPLDTEAARVDWFSGVSLAPWPNRLRGGTWHFGAQQLHGHCNEAGVNALHGLVTDRDFTVRSASAHDVVLETTLGDDAIYPFPVTIRVRYAMEAGALAAEITATNNGDSPVPVALGAHPYFAFGDDSTIETSAQRMMASDARQLPTGELLPVQELGLSPDTPTPLTGLALDDCLLDLTRDADGWAHTVLRHADGTTIDLRQDGNSPYTMVFINRTFPWAHGPAPALAIEPQTAPANALQSGDGLHWLQTGETWGTRWGVRVTFTHP